MDNGDTQNFELDQFNLDTTSEDWGNNPSASSQNHTEEHNQRALGNTAITAPETNPIPEAIPKFTLESTPTPTPTIPVAPELGQVTPAMPPGYEAPTSPDVTPPTPQAFSFQPHHAMSGDHLSPAAVSALQDRERELSADGDIASFVDFVNTARDQIQGKEVA